MATISTFEKRDIQPALQHDGNSITFQESWCLVLSANATPVEADSLVNALTSGNAYGWPIIGETAHPDNSSLKPVSWSVEREPARLLQFDVQLNYSNDLDAISTSQRALDADPVYNFSTVDTVIEVDIDPINEEAIAASNGEPYFPKLTKKGSNKRITISRNELQYDPSRASGYENKMNKTALTIDGRSYPARTLLLESWQGKSAIDVDGTDYYQVQYQFLYDPNTHKVTLIDAATGPDNNGTNPQLYRLTEGKAHKLDGSGVYLGRTAQNDVSQYFTNEFYLHEEITMSFLRL